MEIKNLVPVEWSNQRVLLTAQLAEFYDCEPRHISDNFKRNEDRFVEGKHYYRLEGESLTTFRNTFAESGLQILRSAENGLQISSKTRKLYLWTERGAARHAKMLSTDKAWEVYEELEDNYFNPNTVIVVDPAPAVKPDLARVYLLLLSDGTVQIVKIGHSKNIRSRVAKIKRETGLTVVDMYFTPYMPRDNARFVEWASQEVLSAWRVKGEIFSVNFSKARATIRRFVKLTAVKLSSESVNLIADK